MYSSRAERSDGGTGAARGGKEGISSLSLARRGWDGRRVPKPAVSRCSNMPCAEYRVIGSPRRRGRAASAEFQGRAPGGLEVDHQLVLGRGHTGSSPGFYWCRQLFERGLSHRGLPLKAGVPCIMRVLPGKRRCRFHGGLSIVRCPRTGRACSEGACRERHWCRQLFERGLSHRGLPLTS